MKTAFIGLGVMGYPMAGHMKKAGFDVTVYNRTTAKAEKWAEANYPGEWIKKPVKIPHLPMASKSAKKNLKNVAAMLDNLDWEDDDEDVVQKVVIQPDN